MTTIRAIDLFCGAGGSSCGAHAAGAEIVAGFDVWDLAGQVYNDNFPEAMFYRGRLEEMNVDVLAEQLGDIDLLIASPECTNHSPAKGSAPRCEASRDTAFEVIRFARKLKPRWVVVENVISMMKWSRYKEFLGGLMGLGYKLTEQKLTACDFGVPQKRRRLFIVCDMKQTPSRIKRAPGPKRQAAGIIQGNGAYRFSPLRTGRRAEATVQRAERAIAAVGAQTPFLIVYYGSDQAGGWQCVEKPLRTVTTLDRFAYVRPGPDGHVMRMLQPEELKLAMGWPETFRIEHGTRRDRIRMIGNAVCPGVMTAIVASLLSNMEG